MNLKEKLLKEPSGFLKEPSGFEGGLAVGVGNMKLFPKREDKELINWYKDKCQYKEGFKLGKIAGKAYMSFTYLAIPVCTVALANELYKLIELIK